MSRISIVDPVEKHMEVIVDDSQLSLAIGKKGQNVRLAAKLLGWKIDIKSEEEKRQEVESQMAALVAPGAPVSVLIDYGLPENVAAKLVEAGVGTIEKLGGMTPEELEAIQGIDLEAVEQLEQSVNAYYSQFEEQAAAAGTADAAEAAETAECREGRSLLRRRMRRSPPRGRARNAGRRPGSWCRMRRIISLPKRPRSWRPKARPWRKRARNSLVRWKTRVPPLKIPRRRETWRTPQATASKGVSMAGSR